MSFADDMRAIKDGADKFNAARRHSVNQPKAGSPKVGRKTDRQEPDETPTVGRKAMPTPKGWQGFTESAEPTWKVSNPNGVKARRVDQAPPKAEKEQPKAAKADKPKAEPKAPVERGATMFIFLADRMVERKFDTAAEAKAVAEAFHIRKDVRFIRVVTVNGKATLYHVEGRPISAIEFMKVLTPDERKLIAKRIPAYQKPGAVMKRTVNGANMTGQVVGDTNKGKAFGRMQKAQRLGQYNR